MQEQGLCKHASPLPGASCPALPLRVLEKDWRLGEGMGFPLSHLPAVSLSSTLAMAFNPAVGSNFSPVCLGFLYSQTSLITAPQRCQHWGAVPPSQRSAS